MARILNTKIKAGRVGYKINTTEDADSGAKMAYARLVPYSKRDANYIVKWGAEFCGVTEAQMESGFAALSKALQYFVLNGHSVTLNGMGCFSFSTKTGIWDERNKKWTSAGKNTMDEVSSDDIKGVYLRFRPSTELANALGSSQFFYVGNTTFGYQLENQDIKS